MPCGCCWFSLAGSPLSGAERDPLPSWNDGASKKSIVDFVDRVTREGGPDYVKPEERIATFDHDGTLWAEQPMYFQIMFAMDRVRALAPKHPDWKTKQPFKAVLDRDIKALAALGETGFVKIMAVTHTGITTDEFSKIVADWIATARHPRFDRPYTELVYQPMLELLSFLRANGFKTFIVSGGGVEFMRVFTERVYGIPPEQVVGSSGVVKFQLRPNDKPVLLKDGKIEFVDEVRESRWASTVSSGDVRSSRLEIPTAINRCWNGPRRAAARGSWAWCITPTPSASGPTIASPLSAGWTRRGTKR